MPEHPVHEFRPGTLTPHGCERCGKVKSAPVHRQGGEGKYGRLFTEEDVVAIVAEAIRADRSMMASAGLRGAALVTADAAREHARAFLAADPVPVTFPADEPLFLLRAQDESALYGFAGGYLTDLRYRRAAPREHIEAVIAAHRRMLEWQRANPDRVKVPD